MFEATSYSESDLLGAGDPPLTDPDDVPEPPVTPVTKPGDLWLLGKHRVLCGDSTVPTDVERLMDGTLFDLLVTSPPYNQRIDSFRPSGMQKENPAWADRMARAYADSKPEDAYQCEQVGMLVTWAGFGVENASAFYNHKIRYRDKRACFPLEWLMRTPWIIRQEIVWDRASSVTLNARMFMPQDERIYWLTRTPTWYFADTTEVKSWGTVWPIAPRAEIQASAPFPVAIPERCIIAGSPTGARVVDPYGGSGSTLIACEQTGRVAYLCEIDPHYVDVICRRFQDFTGTKPVLESTGEPHDFT
jgi:DNA modification methylase